MNVPANALQRHRFDVSDYRRMGEAGVFGPDVRVELIDGEIIDMVPIGPIHNGVVDHLNRLFVRATDERAVVRTRGSFELSMWSEPEPDLTILAPHDDFYKRTMPVPADVLLVIEVADSSLVRDRDVKLPSYARHGVPEAWLVDLVANRLTVHRDRSERGYASTTEVGDLCAVSPLRFPDISFDLSDLF